MEKIITRLNAEQVGVYEVLDCNGNCGKTIVYNLDDAIQLAKELDYRRGKCNPEFLATVWANGVRVY